VAPSASQRLLTLRADNQLLPLSNYGLKSMSMGYLIPESSPVAWRGIMVMKALQQLLHEVDWGGLDVLVLDMPPGTGDVQLTITQQLILDGAIVVSTPQDLALKDAAKGVELFRKVDVTLLGLVCNMAAFKCPGCGHFHDVFGNMDKIRNMCEKYHLKMLGEIPLHGSISDDADKGRPTVVARPHGDHAHAFAKIAEQVEGLIGLSK
jgi:ATP-binding protein involved in chromosome partitioning